MGVAPTGNGRRESYAHLPMPRMTNTYMLAGESDPEEIIRSVKKGIYCASLGGGRGHHQRQVRLPPVRPIWSKTAGSLRRSRVRR